MANKRGLMSVKVPPGRTMYDGKQGWLGDNTTFGRRDGEMSRIRRRVIVHRVFELAVIVACGVAAVWLVWLLVTG